MRLDKDLANKVLLDTPIFANTRIPTDALDYGDEATVTLSLKRRNTNIFGGDPNNKFALYLGNHKGKFIVGVHNLGNKLNFNATECFDSLDEMKKEWELD
jgi:hypothetical protein